MEKKKVVPVWLSVVLFVLAMASMVYYAYNTINWISYGGFSSIVIMYVAAFIDAVLVIVYCVMGYKKSAAGVFKAYCIVLIIGLMASEYLAAPMLTMEGLKVINTINYFNIMIELGIWFVLTFATDLGKKKSLCLCGISLLLRGIHVIMIIPYGINTVISSFCGFVIYVTSFIMVYAKYKDKEARGTK